VEGQTVFIHLRDAPHNGIHTRVIGKNSSRLNLDSEEDAIFAEEDDFLSFIFVRFTAAPQAVCFFGDL
jgi:hypothetical protein